MVDQAIKKRAVHRARILKGQLEGLLRAIECEEYCTSLLLHSRSIQRSLKSLDALLLENHLKSHVRHQMRSPKEQNRAIRELLTIYNVSEK